MPPVLSSIETVVQALIYHPHSSAQRLADIIEKNPDRYGPIGRATVYQSLNRLRELNLVRVHFDDEGALYEFGNQPHPIFVCVRCPRESARQDMLFNFPAGPFFQPSSTKDGRTKLTPPHTLLHLIEFCDFQPFTYRFEVLGYCRLHTPDLMLMHHAHRFLQFLLDPEKQFVEFRLEMALHKDELVKDSYALLKQLMASPKVGAVTTRAFDKPSQYLADHVESMVDRMNENFDDLVRRALSSDPETSQAARLAIMLYDRAFELKRQDLINRLKESGVLLESGELDPPPDSDPAFA